METQTEGRGLAPGVQAGTGPRLFKEAGKQGVESEGGLWSKTANHRKDEFPELA